MLIGPLHAQQPLDHAQPAVLVELPGPGCGGGHQHGRLVEEDDKLKERVSGFGKTGYDRSLTGMELLALDVDPKYKYRAPKEGIITGSAPSDITQCAVDCSIQSRVLDGAALRSPSGWKKQALMPILRREVMGFALRACGAGGQRCNS